MICCEGFTFANTIRYIQSGTDKERPPPPCSFLNIRYQFMHCNTGSLIPKVCFGSSNVFATVGLMVAKTFFLRPVFNLTGKQLRFNFQHP